MADVTPHAWPPAANTVVATALISQHEEVKKIFLYVNCGNTLNGQYATIGDTKALAFGRSSSLSR